MGKKITELTQLTTPTSDDLLVVVDNPLGSPVTKKTTVEDLGWSIFSITGSVINVLDPQYDVTGLGVVDDSTAIGVVDTAANGKTLIFPSGTYKISNDLTITSPVMMLGGAKFSIDSGKILTFNGSFHAGLYQVFNPLTSWDRYSSNKVTGWTNNGTYPYETLVTSGANITSAINLHHWSC